MRLTLVSEASSELGVDGEALEDIPPSASVMNASMTPSLRLTDVLHGNIAINKDENWERGEESLGDKMRLMACTKPKSSPKHFAAL